MKAKQAVPKAPLPFKNLQVMKPGGLFAGMIAPLVPYAMRGVIWYQGERNAAGPFTGLYGLQLRTLIADWRSHWSDDFHFAYVQLPAVKGVQKLPCEPSGWGVAVRDGQRRALAVPRTSMAITIDLGGEASGHPTNKVDYARRLSRAVLHDVYQKRVGPPTGPLFKSAKAHRGRMILAFDHAEGLKAKAGKLEGFGIAGADGQFVWAQAKIENDGVILWHAGISEPKAACYGWSANPRGNLVNAAGLPASPFITNMDIAFQPAGMWIWDNWFVHDGAQWHAFYLQLPKAVGPERRWKDNDFYKHVGHATSTDLQQWRDEGPALCALSGTWNDRHIATGSILRHDDRWWMFFTGRGTKADGVGLALSDDLTTWKTEPQPLFPLADTFAKTGAAPFESPWEGEARRWIGISDPYILPEKQGDWFYLVLCARVLDVTLPESGCLAMVRSRDLRHWEAAGIVAWPRCFERMETPQLWQREGRWHLSFGGVLDPAWAKANQAALPTAVRGKRSHQNYSYKLPRLDSSARDDDLRHIAVPHDHYIMKVLPAGGGRDLAIFTCLNGNDSGMSPAYPVTYGRDHSLQIHAEAVIVPKLPAP